MTAMKPCMQRGGHTMNADVLKRVVRAIASGSPGDLTRLARKIIDDERRNGHTKLADQLESILSQPPVQKGIRGLTTEHPRALGELPTSRRHGELLATVLPRESLEHHMVLPPATEDRFARVECE